MIGVIESARGADQEMGASTKIDARIARDREEIENLQVAVVLRAIIRGWKMEEIDEGTIETDEATTEIVGAMIVIDEAMILIAEQVETGT